MASNPQIETVRAADATATGTLVSSQKGRLRGVHYNDASGGTAGTVVLKDGGSGGTAILTVNTPGQGAGDDVVIPGSGIPFATDLHVTLSNVDGVTVFYAEDNA